MAVWVAREVEIDIIEVEVAEEQLFFAWFSEKHCLLIAKNEGSFSESLISDLLPVAVIAAAAAAAAAVVSVAVAVVAVLVAAVEDGVVEVVALGVGVCAMLLPLLWLGSLSSASSLASCWYISSTMGFHNRTLALMNQFETWNTQLQNQNIKPKYT